MMARCRFSIMFLTALVALSVLLLHLPSRELPLSTDDYLLLTTLQGDEALSGKGFEIADGSRPASDRIINLFHFFGTERGTQRSYRDYGSLVWWSSESGLMSPFRPVAAITHWLDVNVLGFSPLLVTTHSVLYLLLMWIAALTLYRRLATPRLALLASALLLFDVSLALNFDWMAARNAYMAVAFGILTLIAHMQWRESGAVKFLFVSLLLFLCSVLTAEAAIALLGYVGAYALFLDRQGWLKGSFAVLPYVLVTLAWRWVYSDAGFGSSDIGLYVDPGRDLGDFAYQLSGVFPCIVTSLITGIDGFVSPFDPEARPWVRAVAWMVTVLGIFLVRGLLRTDRQVRFMLVGSVLAAIPHASLLTAGSRSGTFVAIGFFYVLAVWIGTLWSVTPRLHSRRILAGLVLVWHLLVPSALILWQTLLVPAAKDDANGLYGSVEQSLRERDRSLVIVNPPWAPTMFYLPFEWSHKDRVLPRSINAMAPGLGPLELTRLSERRFRITASGKMVVNQSVEFSGQDRPLLHAAYSYQVLQGLVTARAHDYSEGDTRTAGQMKVTVMQEVDGVPTGIEVEFIGNELPDGMVWQYFDWRDETYKRMQVPAVGESFPLAGPFG